jgi:hypothetical protein
MAVCRARLVSVPACLARTSVFYPSQLDQFPNIGRMFAFDTSDPMVGRDRALDVTAEDKPMVVGLIVLQLVATQPAVRQSPKTTVQRGTATALVTPKQQKLADARALLASAKRIQASYVPKPGQPSKAELDASIEQLKDKLDSLPEMSEMDQLRLEMVMEGLSKTESTLSNLLKKIGDTQGPIVQNIK